MGELIARYTQFEQHHLCGCR